VNASLCAFGQQDVAANDDQWCTSEWADNPFDNESMQRAWAFNLRFTDHVSGPNADGAVAFSAFAELSEQLYALALTLGKLAEHLAPVTRDDPHARCQSFLGARAPGGAGMNIIARELARRLGLKKYTRSWRGPCPCCDYPGITFSVLSAPDGSARLYCANGCNRDNLIYAVAHVMGHPERSAIEPSGNLEHRARNKDRALAQWRGSASAIDTPADRYLTARDLPGLAAAPSLRFRADTPHPEGGRLPAMIALVTDVAGEPLGIHRTYLGRDGSKARVEPVKASLGPVWGGAIRLDSLRPDVPLVIGEGIESSASAGRLMGFLAWAAVSAGNLARGLVLPPEARRVVIAADPDDAGRNAAREAWLRWKAEGRDVQIALPHREGCDFNDLLLARDGRHG
jgi:hypothetical protein